MNKTTFTVDDVMALDPCYVYSRKKVEELWAGREYLTYDEIMKLDIPSKDIEWFLERSGFSGVFEFSTGSKYWFENGKFHREDGPAIEYSGGTKSWWVNGKFIRREP